MLQARAPSAARRPSVPLGTSVESLHKSAPWRANRYRLLAVAARVLYDGDRPVELQHPTCWCQRGVRAEQGAGLYRRNDGGGARLGGVQTCQRPWTCPVCCMRLANGRAEELRDAVERWIIGGGEVHLVTYTFPHAVDQPLAEMLTAFYKARQAFANSRTYKRIRGETESPGVVRSTEVTYGRNGWHPHLHELFFANRLLTVAEVDELRGEWVRHLQRVGLVTNRSLSDAMDYALDVRGGADASDYVAKFGREQSWGLGAELTKTHAKTGEGDKGAKPFRLLELAGEGHGWAAERFREFDAAFKLRRLLTWSPGLRKQLGLGDEPPDEAIDDAPDVLVANVTPTQLAVVHARRALPDLLELVAMCCDGPDAQHIVDEWISGLRQVPRGKQRELVRMPRPFGGGRPMIVELPN